MGNIHKSTHVYGVFLYVRVTVVEFGSASKGCSGCGAQLKAFRLWPKGAQLLLIWSNQLTYVCCRMIRLDKKESKQTTTSSRCSPISWV